MPKSKRHPDSIGSGKRSLHQTPRAAVHIMRPPCLAQRLPRPRRHAPITMLMSKRRACATIREQPCARWTEDRAWMGERYAQVVVGRASPGGICSVEI